MSGRTLEEARSEIIEEIAARRVELDELAAKLVSAGLAEWSGAQATTSPSLIVRGQGRLLEDVGATGELDRIRDLFDEIDRKSDLIQLLEMAKQGSGVRIFIGAENKLYSLSGSSVIAAPYSDESRRVVGVIGVIGPTRLNYARIVPMVDYTARVVSRLINKQN
jgi:heat-inducible transcriptional repressor